jgi:RNA polymerase sigma-70 factor (ECF subfamily)
VNAARAAAETLYRAQAAAMTAALCRAFGPANLDLAESVVHDAFLEALARWPATGLPDNPGAWVLTVARRKALDVLRRSRRFAATREALVATFDPPVPDSPGFAWEVPDDLLRMMFVACHPAIPLESRVALALRTLFTLGEDELAGLLLSSADAVHKRLVRARKVLRAEGVRFDLPGPEVLSERLAVVLEVLRLVFTEGYAAHAGDEHVRAPLCHEALRLVDVLAAHPPTSRPIVHATAALFALHASRLGARVDDDGALVPLAEQDRTRWDQGLIRRGLAHLALSQGDTLDAVHLEAAIAACHALARSFDDTDWTRIVTCYDRLVVLDRSPVVAVHRAVAVSWRDGPLQGLDALAPSLRDPRLARDGVLAAAEADLLARAGRRSAAANAWRRAAELAATPAERAFALGRAARQERARTG